MTKRFSTTAFAGLALLGAVTILATPAAAADPFALTGNVPAPAAAKTGPTTPAGLERLAVEPDALFLPGEKPESEFPLYVTAAQTAGAARLVLTYDTAISVDPEVSRMQVLVNDQLVGETRLGYGDRQRVAIELPAGMLQPGFNAVRVLVDQQHRVDCSLPGTYELWTRIDPASSGLLLPSAAGGVPSLAELPGLRSDENGRVAIRGIVSAGRAPVEMEQTLAAIQATAIFGRFAAPSVDMANERGGGEGIDVRVGTFAQLTGLPGFVQTGNTEIPFVSLVPGDAKRRTMLVVSGATTDEVATNVAAFAKAAENAVNGGTSSGLQALARAGGLSLDSGSIHSLADLGSLGRPFGGRHFTESVSVRLPADFYAADYDYATIALNASYAGGLAKDAKLIVRANGREVSTLALSSPRPSRIENQRLRIPLSAFKPGQNTITFEALLPTPSDLTCDTAVAISRQARFQLSNSSTLQMPRLARIGHYPDLSATLAGLPRLTAKSEAGLSLYVPGLDTAALSAAGTFVAKMAVTSGKVVSADILADMPHQDVGNLIAFGTRSSLPAGLLTTAGLSTGASSTMQMLDGSSPAATHLGSAASETPGALDALLSPIEFSFAEADETSSPVSQFLASLVQRIALGERLKQAVQPLIAPLAALAGPSSAFASDWKEADLFTPGVEHGLVLSQGVAPLAPKAAWTVVSAADSASLVEGVEALTQSARWAEIGGAITTLSGADNIVEVREATSEHLFATQSFSPGNWRLVVAGWFSRHLEQYVLTLGALCVLLGFSTFLFLRSVGVKNR